MKIVWHVATYEFKMQRRSLPFWIVAIVLFIFFFGEVMPQFQTSIFHATSPAPIMVLTPTGEMIDVTIEARQALEVANYSTYMAWLFIDRVGLISALFISFLGAFIWQRDHRWELVDVLNAKPMTSQQYVLGKYLGVILTWGSIMLLLIIIGVGRIYQLAMQAQVSFAWSDFFVPVIAWLGITLLYGTAFIMMFSLVLRSSIGALLIYFFYWIYSLTRLEMLLTPGLPPLLTHWFFRIDLDFSPHAFNIVQQRLSDIWMNRLFYLLLSIIWVMVTIFVYERIRQRGALVNREKEMPSQSSSIVSSAQG